MEFTLEQFQAMLTQAVADGMEQRELAQTDGLFITDKGEVKSFGDWLTSVKERDKAALAEYKTLEVGTGAAGGYTVPAQFLAKLLMVAAEKAIVRPRTTPINIDPGAAVEIPSLDQTSTPDTGHTAFFGGVYAEWIEEGGSKPEHEPEFKGVELRPHELAFITYVTDRLLAQSGLAMDSILTKLFGNALTWHEDYAFLNGDGVGKPMGVIHSPATLQPVRAGANAIVYDDVMAMIHDFLPSANGVWVISNCCQEQILQLKDDNNNFIWQPNVTAEMAKILLGYPIIWSEKLPALGSKGDIILCDFSYYLVADGQPRMRIQASEHYRFTEDITTYRAHTLVDGKPWLSEPLTLQNGSEVSPFVALDEYSA